MVTTSSPTPFRPIGFWLKLVDRLIDESLDAALADAGLTRRHWQVLNLLERGDVTGEDADDQLRPFLSDHELTTRPVFEDLIGRGWAMRDGERFRLTTEGVTSLAPVRATITETRRAAAAGIDVESYQATLAVLERIARNLGWS